MNAWGQRFLAYFSCHDRFWPAIKAYMCCMDSTAIPALEAAMVPGLGYFEPVRKAAAAKCLSTLKGNGGER